MTTSTSVITEIRLSTSELAILLKAQDILENIQTVLFENGCCGIRENTETGECVEESEYSRMMGILHGFTYDGGINSWETVTDYQDIGE